MTDKKKPLNEGLSAIDFLFAKLPAFAKSLGETTAERRLQAQGSVKYRSAV